MISKREMEEEEAQFQDEQSHELFLFLLRDELDNVCCGKTEIELKLMQEQALYTFDYISMVLKEKEHDNRKTNK